MFPDLMKRLKIRISRKEPFIPSSLNEDNSKPAIFMPEGRKRVIHEKKTLHVTLKKPKPKPPDKISIRYPPNLEGMPTEILRNISLYLNLRDISSISDTLPKISKKINPIIENNIVKINHPYLDTSFLKEREEKYRINPNYMNNSSPINWEQRSTVVQWLAEVNEDDRLSRDILFRSVAIFDNYLQTNPLITTRELQLIGAVCYWLGYKLEEDSSYTWDSVDDLVNLCAKAYRRQAFLDYEFVILKSVKYFVNFPVITDFIRPLCQISCNTINNTEEKLTFYSYTCYVAELSLVNKNMLRFLPSKIAASIVYVSRNNFKYPPWNWTLEYYSGYIPSELHDCIKEIYQNFLVDTQQIKSIKSRWSSERYNKVSQLKNIKPVF